MKKIINIQFVLLLLTMAFIQSCKKDYGDLNNPTAEDFLKNASKDQLNNLVSGTESGMRNNLGLYLDETGVIGREIYRFSGSDPRYVTDLLGVNDATLSNNSFYINNPWAARYRVVKNCNLLIQAAANSTLITESAKKGYTGFAKTIKAYQLLLNLNLTYANGIRMEVDDPNNLGPIVGNDEALTEIANLLDEAKSDFGGADVLYPLAGFGTFDNAAGLVQFNRALAARVAVYRQQWSTALTALNESFFNLTGDFYAGVNNVFGTGSGDQLNPVYLPRNYSGEWRLAHPSYSEDIEANDDRIGKAVLRASSVTDPNSGLTGDRDVWVFTSGTAPIPIIRNEELILIYAEANIQTNNFTDAVSALNKIRNGHGLPDYGGAETHDALITEMLNQRRYSLFAEGHRWIDMRRYNLLDELPLDRPDLNVWEEFPLPSTEQ